MEDEVDDAVLLSAQPTTISLHSGKKCPNWWRLTKFKPFREGVV